MHPCPPTIVCSGPGARGKVEGSGINGQLDFLEGSNFKGLKKLAWKSECFSPNVDLPFSCFTYEPRLVSLKHFMGAMAEPLSFMHHDHGSSSERSDDSPSAVSEDDSSGHCGHISPPDPDWTEERFRVDRKKLETMLLAASEGRINGGEDFFQKVMDETNTQIAWPSKLKIGAKSKKDPHIKVSGKREDVREAKETIMSVLDTKSNRVTLKMDVSHTEHSHVIGKGGNNIKRVMEETGCHIHFPDSNRHSQGEKSNQVSIAGQLTGVEAARVKIRELLPLMLMFECSGVVQHVDCSSPVVQHISHTYNVSISFKAPSRLYGNTAIVRGNQNNASGVKRGTALLLEHLAGSLAGSVLVSTQLDIAPQHHHFLLGRNGANVKHISQRTGANIHFPELNTHTSRSAVYIQGSIDGVCAARQQLMGCLPLVLLFDIKEEMEVASQVVTTLMEQLDVFISIKPKPKQPSKSVIVKSVERNAGSMYEVRKILLGLESSSVPSSFNHVTVNGHAPASPPLIGSIGLDTLASAELRLRTLAGILRSVSPISNGSPNPNCVLNGHGSVLSIQKGAVNNTQHIHTSAHTHSHTSAHTHSHAPGHTASLWASALSSTNTSGFSTDLMLQSVSQTTLSGLLLSGVQSQAHAHTPSPPPGLAPIHKPPSAEHLNGHLANSVYSRISSVSLNPGHCDTAQEVIGHTQSESISNKSTDEGSDTFVEVGMPRSPSHSANGSELKQMLASVSSGKRHTMELLQRTKNSLLHVECVLADSDCENQVADKRAPGSERAAERRLGPHMQAYDYEKKKLLATKDTWSGLGFSKSMPAEGMKELRRAHHVPYKPSMSTTYEDPHLSVSLSGSQEGLGNDTKSDNWGDLNGNVNVNGNGLSGNSEFSPAISSPKRIKNKSLGEQYLSSSNYMDSISMPGSNGCSLSSSLKGTDLPELFSKLGLGKYTDIFQQQEIDLQTFVTLTDPDLKELGITTFGARRKMILAISDLNKSRRKLFDMPNIRSSFLEGGASGRLSRQFHSDMASVSGRW
ncbi:protein bicaudal C homolog 1-B isoform X3 [Rhinichthys klamathensis goyatoka]|uniref:protein bicaudal C homolog 1-B isoform X3 n=1 Tax=Rhinichthys klamathensis goyatoka TaxID=3034132 RepID=UPI0024B4FB9A|nr:protein bicaudal C homolog 1-B isoform X3 [Rhinichthys klamathensis goyatoka]